MKSRRTTLLDDSAFSSRPLTELPLFGEIRLSAPSAAGSDTSAEAAELVDVDAECRKVLTWFAAQSEARTRHECAAGVYPETDHGVTSVCARVDQLKFCHYLVQVGRVGKRSTLVITLEGRRWLSKRAAA